MRYGVRSLHWPLNEASPPIPTGPAMSGGFGPIWVDRVSTAALYVVISSCKLLPGYFAAKAAATLSSAGFCDGSSPEPRQQYQRSAAGWKSGM